jgi:cell division protein FtsI/penicillin-binding protein 2
MALVAAGVVNGGSIMKPHVMSEVDDSDGNQVRTYNPSEWKRAVRNREGNTKQRSVGCGGPIRAPL